MNFHYGRGKSPSPLAARPILRKRKPRDVSRGQIVDKPSVCQRICPTACLRTVSPTAAQCSGAAHCVCSRLQPLRGLQRPATGTGMHFYVSHRPSIQHGRSTALASSLVALPASLGLLRPVSATGGGLRAPLRFACAVFRACALRVLATSALRAFTFLQAFALLKMPEMTYMPSFLIRASFFRDFGNTLWAVKKPKVFSQPPDH